mmetsp:Transcript_106778/g.319224  ORF Transcript_106778/g.319224 Transcript_106778/m.319224 type:complete len:107 (-) Transcript_106778:623-943(-)
MHPHRTNGVQASATCACAPAAGLPRCQRKAPGWALGRALAQQRCASKCLRLPRDRRHGAVSARAGGSSGKPSMLRSTRENDPDCSQKLLEICSDSDSTSFKSSGGN